MKLLTKEWTARDETLADIVEEIKELRMKERIRVQFTWEPRKANKVADEMTRLASTQKHGSIIWACNEEKVAVV